LRLFTQSNSSNKSRGKIWVQINKESIIGRFLFIKQLADRNNASSGGERLAQYRNGLWSVLIPQILCALPYLLLLK
jgi:hypothetical protein